ncbi:hypothetical protein [Ktedonospora formicarum]|uniref:Glycosyl transferase family 3 domain-containing protein n=1 Tax=Ktedonospora formicarum TaxID=2778364 RepID=A0A8J3HYJ3_9CHLR|nr:hypothetical protein [Ktedonospora formicarum]GHO44326.1 hypothetical protein KSX_24890 [Ktedonospora formicarum]
MGNLTSLPARAHHPQVRLRKDDLHFLFASDVSQERKEVVLNQLGSLRSMFEQFLAHERQLEPPDDATLITKFDMCSDPTQSPETLLKLLHELAPGNGHIGQRQINLLADHLRARVERFLQRMGLSLDQLHTHDHVFGSGGDFCKTIHASTAAAIAAAPLVKICKTGTTNVTSCHGSAQAMETFGYHHRQISMQTLNQELDQFGFTFVPLSALDFPYSPALKEAREHLWHEAMDTLTRHDTVGSPQWHETLRTTPITLDIFKIVSPNAQVLRPAHHSTGICSLPMLPYVLSLYLHLNSEGMIVHCYDGIDELSNASSQQDPSIANNLLVHVTRDEVIFEECSPEDMDLKRAYIEEIQEEVDLEASQNETWHILSGEKDGPKRDFIVMNTALLLIAHEQHSPSEGYICDQLRLAIKRVEEIIDSHQVADNFSALLNAHQHHNYRQENAS